MSPLRHGRTEEGEYGADTIGADGFFLPALRARRQTDVGLQQSYFEALRRMYEPELSTAGGVRLADAHHRIAAALTPLWVEAAWLRGLIETERKPDAAADVLRGDEVHLKLSDAGHRHLAEIEGGWPLVPLATAAQAQSWMLRTAWNLLLALLAGTAIGVTAALANLRQSPLAWVVLAVILLLAGFLLWRRWQLVQRTRRTYRDYWLYHGDRKHFERSQQDMRHSPHCRCALGLLQDGLLLSMRRECGA